MRDRLPGHILGAESVLYSYTGRGQRTVWGRWEACTGKPAEICSAPRGAAVSRMFFGTAFEVKPTGAESVLHLLAQSPGGAVPQARFVSDVAGNLYGTTALGGRPTTTAWRWSRYCVRADADGQRGWNESVIHALQGRSDGLQPYGDLATEASGLYGVTPAAPVRIRAAGSPIRRETSMAARGEARPTRLATSGAWRPAVAIPP